MTFCKYRCFSTLVFVIKTKKFNITILYFFIKLFWLIKLTICAFQDQWHSIRDNPMFQRFDVLVYQRSAYFGSEYIYLFLKMLFGWLHVQPSKTYSRGFITIWWMCMGLCEGEGGMFQGIISFCNSVQIPCDVHTKSIKKASFEAYKSKQQYYFTRFSGFGKFLVVSENLHSGWPQL